MAIHTPTPGTADDLDVPDVMKSEQSARPALTLVTEPAAPAAAPVEGTVVKHRGEETPSRSKQLVARAGGHAASNHLYVTWVVRGWGHLLRRWTDAYRDDYPQLIASAKAELRAAAGKTAAETAAKKLVKARRAEYREHKKWHLIKSSGWTVATAGGVATGAIVGGGMVDLLMATAALAVGAYHGRPELSVPAQATPATFKASSVPAQAVHAAFQPGPTAPAGAPSSAEQPVMTTEQLPEGGKPFPLAQAQTPEQVAECVLRALLAEGVPVVEVSGVVRQPWGWQCVARVGEGTPEAIIKASGDLETRLDLATNGVRPQPMIERRACTVLRLVDRGANPFATAPGLPYRAPKSISITEKSRLGTSVGGDPLQAAFAGVMGLVVAASGGGKTGLLQAIGEITTACYDNITIDLDPHGDGLEDLHDGVRVTARSHEQIEAVLLFLLMLSKGRARLRAKLGMGKKWKISKEHPHFTAIFDEFPKGSELAKRLAFELLLVGRKEAVTLIIASQGGTRLYLGENIAQMIALKAVGPCKVGDTRAVFGDGAVAEGWLPHKLSPATDTDPKDAGHIFIQGVPGTADEPIEYAVHETPSATLRKLAAERLDAGLVEPDQDSLDAMRGVDLPEFVEPVYDAEGNLKKEAPVELLTWERLLRLCDAEPPTGATPEPSRILIGAAVDLMDKASVDRMRTEVLRDALADFDPDAYGDLTTDALKELLAQAGVGKPVTLGPLDGLANPRGFKREALARHL